MEQQSQDSATVPVRYARLFDRTGHGTDAPPMALVLIDGSSANKDVNVSMGKGHLGLSEEMLPTSRDARSVPLTPLFLEVNRQIIETRDFLLPPHTRLPVCYIFRWLQI